MRILALGALLSNTDKGLDYSSLSVANIYYTQEQYSKSEFLTVVCH